MKPAPTPARLLSLLLIAPLLGGCIALKNLPLNTELGCDTALAGHWHVPGAPANTKPVTITAGCQLNSENHTIFHLAQSIEMGRFREERPSELGKPLRLQFSTFQHQGQGYLRFDPHSMGMLVAATIPDADTGKDLFPLPPGVEIDDSRDNHILLGYQLEGDALKISTFHTNDVLVHLEAEYGNAAIHPDDSELINLTPEQLDTALPTLLQIHADDSLRPVFTLRRQPVSASE